MAPSGERRLADKIEQMEQSALYLVELAGCIHEHGDMLFRIADNLQAEAAKLRSQMGAADVGGPICS